MITKFYWILTLVGRDLFIEKLINMFVLIKKNHRIHIINVIMKILIFSNYDYILSKQIRLKYENN